MEKERKEDEEEEEEVLVVEEDEGGRGRRNKRRVRVGKRTLFHARSSTRARARAPALTHIRMYVRTIVHALPV